MSHLKRHVLANVGLLIATLISGDEEIVQVTRSAADPRFAPTAARPTVLPFGLTVDPSRRLQVSMVTQVTPNADGVLIRSVYSPLE